MSQHKEEQSDKAAGTDRQNAQEKASMPPGRVEWLELTAHDAGKLRDFYKAVVGWNSSEADMGSYADYNMHLQSGGETVAGICHKRGGNANLPSQWLVYVRVENIQESISACESRGGKILDGPRLMAGMRFCVIEDPAGAVMALMSQK